MRIVSSRATLVVAAMFLDLASAVKATKPVLEHAFKAQILVGQPVGPITIPGGYKIGEICCPWPSVVQGHLTSANLS